MPPCAHLVEPSSILALVTSKTDKLCERRFNAVVKPATPEPITITSAVVVQPGVPLDNFMRHFPCPYCRASAPHLPNRR